MPLTDTRALSTRQPDGTPTDNRYQLVPAFTFGSDNAWRLLLNGDIRVRAESRINFDGNTKTRDNDELFVSRERLSADLTYKNRYRFFAEGMQAAEPGLDNASVQASDAHLHQAYMEAALSEGSPWSTRLGVQELVWGRDRRILNAGQFTNLRRTYVGARLMYRTPKVDMDFIVVQPRTNDERVDGVRLSGAPQVLHDTLFYGTFATLRPLKETSVELYALGLEDRMRDRYFPTQVADEFGQQGSQDRYTVGGAVYTPLFPTPSGRVTGSLGGAWQWGHRSTDEIKSYMYHGDIAHEWTHASWKPRLSMDWTVSSGDRELRDGENNTFSNLFGRNFVIAGRTLLLRPQNLQLLGPTLRMEPRKDLRIQAQAYQYWADSSTDSWISGRNVRLGGDRQGDSSRNIGRELNILANYRIKPWWEVEVGGAALFPDSYSRANNRPDVSGLVYLQSWFSF